MRRLGVSSSDARGKSSRVGEKDSPGMTGANSETTVHDAARKAYAAGLCVLPPVEDGSKRPQDVDGTWQPFKTTRPTREQMQAWYPGRSGLGIVAGPASGGAECLDFDDRDTYHAFLDAAKASDLGPLVARLETGYCDDTPGGGVRWLWRCPHATREHNQKLARRPKLPDEKQHERDNVKTLIELPDYAIVAPSNGRVHPTGGGYRRRAGDFDSIAIITAEERQAILDLARMFDAMPASEPHLEERERAAASDGTRPGDDYVSRTIWRDVLTGWTEVYRRGEVAYWRRPGKSFGVSASTNHGGSDLLYVFSTSTEFEPGRGYNRFSVYAILNHGGDFKAAARTLGAQGYGNPPSLRAAAAAGGRSGGDNGGDVDPLLALVPLGQPDPETGKFVLSPKQTLPTAEAYVRMFHTHPDGRLLHAYAGLLLEWQHNRYSEIEDGAIKSRLQQWLHQAMRYVVVDRHKGRHGLVPFESNPSTVQAALESIRAYTYLASTVPSPAWLDGRTDLSALEILPCRTANVHIPTGRIIPSTPALFTTSALDFDFNPNAPAPTEWLAFLRELWEGDDESIQLLQEWFGYCLIPDTSQQKMLLQVGPRRSGKGTIGRILTRLIGQANVIGPTTGSLAGQFGLQPLIGKSLAIVSDARFTGEHVGTVVERLLCISGEDTLTVDRKFLGAVTLKLPTRMMFLTNELPRLNDASSALAGRFLILRLTRSFYGEEDPTLTERLTRELPGILLWAMEGWVRLQERGRFVQPASSAEAIRDLEDLASPVGAFVRDYCHTLPGLRITTDQLYAAWQMWCQQEGRHAVGTKKIFGRDLAAAVSTVVPRRDTNQKWFYDGISLTQEAAQALVDFQARPPREDR